MKSTYGDIEYVWQAKLVRTEGFFDDQNHTLYVVAKIEDPYMLSAPTRRLMLHPVPLLMGTYVQADIQGQAFTEMVTIPRHLLRAGNHVWVVDQNNQLRNRQLDILKTGGEQIYVAGGLDDGERICITNVGEVVPGTQVRIAKNSPPTDPHTTAMHYE